MTTVDRGVFLAIFKELREQKLWRIYKAVHFFVPLNIMYSKWLSIEMLVRFKYSKGIYEGEY